MDMLSVTGWQGSRYAWGIFLLYRLAQWSFYPTSGCSFNTSTGRQLDEVHDFRGCKCAGWQHQDLEIRSIRREHAVKHTTRGTETMRVLKWGKRTRSIELEFGQQAVCHCLGLGFGYSQRLLTVMYCTALQRLGHRVYLQYLLLGANWVRSAFWYYDIRYIIAFCPYAHHNHHIPHQKSRYCILIN